MGFLRLRKLQALKKLFKYLALNREAAVRRNKNISE